MNTSVSTIMSALAEPRRQQIVELLAQQGQMNATDIANRFEVSSAAISQHLKLLRQAEIVVMTKQAQQRRYELNPKAFAELEKWSQQMQTLWSARFDQLDALLNKS